jgi:FkbH-like protein
VLGQHPVVQQAVVVAQLDRSGDWSLVAYIVSKQEQVLNKSEVRRFLKVQLPEYMIPAAFVVLETLPLTSNGKVDRRALPTLNTSQKDTKTFFVSPRTPTEEILANLWTDILGVDVGIHENFFELGGHSLLATQLISRVRQAFSIELPLRCLFESPTIAELSATIEIARQTGLGQKMPAIKPIHRNQDLPLSFAQERLWFLDQLGEASTTYNEQVALRLIGCLQKDALKMTILEIVQRHEVLRTTFKMVNGSPVQAIAPDITLTLPIIDLQGLSEKEQSAEIERIAAEEAQQPFDLAYGPLLRVKLLLLGKEVHILLLTMHHIISDGWSMNVFNHEMSMLYEAFSNGKPSPLPVLPIQYADFAVWERTWLQGDVLETRLNYWTKKLEGTPTSLNLPTDYPRPQSPTYKGSIQYLQLPHSLSEELKAFAMRQGVTLFMTLCAIFQILLYKYSGQKDFVIATSEANRNLKEVESLIGFFVNQLLFRSDFGKDISFQEFLRQVREETLSAYENKHLPFSRIVQETRHERDISRNPLFQVLFILHNTPQLKNQWTADLEISPLRLSTQTSRLDAMISISEQEQGFLISWEYSTDLFEEKTIQLLLSAYQNLLGECIRQPEKRISEFQFPQKNVENTSSIDNNINEKKFHHLGFACRDIKEGIAHINKHYHVVKVSDIIFDDIQDANVCLIETENGINIELVSGNQVKTLLNQGVNLYHVCYEVPDLFKAIEEFQNEGALLVSEPKPAKLFDNRLVAFLNTPLGLLELLEKTKSGISEQLIQQLGFSNSPQNQRQTIAIAATFTSDLVEEFLTFWMQELGMECQIEFAAYNQVFQQLLDSSSQLSQNKNGINVILVRFEDWQKYEKDFPPAVTPSTANIYEDICENIERNVQDFVLALKSSAQRSGTPHLVFICPASPQFLEDSNRSAFFHQMQQQIVSELVNFSNIYPVTSSELSAIYPVSDYHDPLGNKLGHVPYTSTFFSALGTMIARKIFQINTAPYKVIVLDCDQTLWQGVCGEDGALGVEIDPPRQSFQEFIVAQHNAGKLICLSSKNDESDVWAVFEHHQLMPLKREHLVSWRINWKSKSENIQSLARELQVGLDSFIFIDDNPVECAEVQAKCPEVLTIQLPQQPNRIPEFLKHIWAFDSLKVTKEDLARTELYRQNFERERWREKSLTFTDFLAGLKLQVKIDAITSDKITRVSQLTQRTNQFNFTTIRRSEGEIQQLFESGQLECLKVEVKDRFGDYGLVGTILFKSGVDAITVDTFLLSCRVLGRGVEHKMLAEVGNIARERRLERVDVLYIPTQKNHLAFDFLNNVGAEFKQEVDRDWLFRFPVELISQLTFISSIKETTPASDLPTQTSTVTLTTHSAAKSTLYQRIATKLYNAPQILHLVKSQKYQERPELKQAFVEPRSSVEELVVGIWREILNLDRVGIYDNFFELGGHSLLAVQVISRLQEAFCVKLSLLSLFKKSTVAGIAEHIEKILCTAQLQISTSNKSDEREEIEL